MKFSIIIPTYNRKNLLIKCLNELEKQTFEDFEVIVIDDGSTDGSEIVNDTTYKFKLLYKKITNSGGPARPRNIGISISSGDFICLLDVDDYWFENKLEVCLNYLNNDIDILYHDMLILDEMGLQVGIFKSRELNKNDVVFDLFKLFNPICNSSVIIRRKALGLNLRFNEDTKYHFVEDFELWIRIALTSNKFHYLNKTLGVYLSHSSNNSNNLSIQSSKIEILYSTYLSSFSKKQQKIIIGSLNYYLGCQNDKMSIVDQKISLNYYYNSLRSSTFRLKLKSLMKIIKISIRLLYV
jgi:glycosyltransferase involved in cell wall biosynthesis